MTLFNKKYASLYDDINSEKKYMIIGRRFLKILMISAAVAAAFACKKDDEEEEALPSLGGMVKFSLDPYMEVNSTFRVEPSGIYHPEGKGFGYYCKASWKESNDTIKLENSDSFIEEKMLFTFPEDSVGTFTISCTAFASGYYSTSVSRYVTTVSRERSLIDTLLGYDATAYPAGEVIDNRDGEGRTYRTVRIGNAEWFAENLAYKGLDHASGDNQGKAVFGIPYQNCEAMSDIFGRYYTWKEAMGLDEDGNPSGVKLCPDGWTVPTDEDWKNLAAELQPEASGIVPVLVAIDVDAFEDIRGIEAKSQFSGLAAAPEAKGIVPAFFRGIGIGAAQRGDDALAALEIRIGADDGAHRIVGHRAESDTAGCEDRFGRFGRGGT